MADECMRYNSDTESEDSNTLPTEFDLDSQGLPTTFTPCTIEDVFHSISFLRSQENEHSADMRNSVPSMQRVENAINCLTLFIKDLAVMVKENWERDTALAFLAIVEPDFLTFLFNLLPAFRRSSPLQMSEAARGVTCIHILLATLSCAIPAITNGGAFAPPNEAVTPDILRIQREADMIRAAARLPDAWKDLPSILSSTGQSPYAKRIVIGLLFAAYVMHPRICQSLSMTPITTPPLHVGPSVYRGIRFIFDHAYSVETLSLSAQWQSDAAMLLSLLAPTCPQDSPDEDTQWIYSKPLLFTECRSHVFQLLQAICGISSDNRHRFAIENVSTVIALRWGNIIPWCWKFFHDEGRAYSEYLSNVTFAWIYHFDTPLFTWVQPSFHWEWITVWMLANGDAANALLSNTFQLLQDEAMTIDQCMNGPMIQVFCKIVEMMLVLLQRQTTHPPIQVPISLVKCIQCALVLIGRLPKSEPNAALLQGAVEALTYVNAEQRSWVFRPMLQDESHPFMQYIAEAMNNCLMCMSLKGTTQMADVVAQTSSVIEILTVMVVSLPDNEALQVIVTDFIRSLVQSMESNDNDAAISIVFKKALLPLTAIGSSGRYDSSRIVDWSLVLRFAATFKDGLSACIVSQYVLVSGHAEDPLTCRELWDYLQDALLNAPDPSSEAEEWMNFFICESIARGLVHILRQCCPLARCHILSSPWTHGLLSKLRDQTEQMSTSDLIHSDGKMGTWTEVLVRQATEDPRIRKSKMEDVNKLSSMANIAFCIGEGLIVNVQLGNSMDVEADDAGTSVNRSPSPAPGLRVP